MYRSTRRYAKQSRDELHRMNHPDQAAIHDAFGTVIGAVVIVALFVITSIVFWHVAVPVIAVLLVAFVMVRYRRLKRMSPAQRDAYAKRPVNLGSRPVRMR